MVETTDQHKLIVSLEARMRSYERAIERAQSQTNSRMRGIESALKRPAAEMDRLGAAAQRMEAKISRAGGLLKNFAGGLASGIAAGVSIDGAQRLLDAATRIRNSLKSAGLEGEALTKTYDKLFQSAQKNGAPIESMVQLYGRLALVQNELGISSDQIVTFADKVGVALRASGTSASEASGALLQLSQAMGSGIVRAEEFNSILEGAPGIAQAAAAGLLEAGGSVGRLRQLVVDGKVSSKAFFDAFLAGSSAMEQKVATAETTISGAFVRLQNVLVDTALKFDAGTGASKTLADFLNGPLTTALQEVGNIFSGVGDGPVAGFVGWINRAADAVVQAAADIGAATGLDEVGGNPYIGPGRIQSRIDDAFAGASTVPPRTGRLSPDASTAPAAQPAVKPVSLSNYALPAASTGAAAKVASAAQAELDQAIANQTSMAVDAVTAYLGQHEQANRGSINAFLQAGGVNLDAAKQAWCAAFVNSALAQVGVTGSGSSVANSFANWGTGVSTSNIRRGDVLLDMNGAGANQVGGHVGFATGLSRIKDGILEIQMLSGNASHKVQEDWIKASEVIARRANDAMVAPGDLQAPGKLADDWVRHNLEAGNAASATKAVGDQYGILNSVAETALNGIANALQDGKITGEEWLQIGVQIIQQLLQMKSAANGLGNLGGGGGLGGLLGMFFGGGGSAIPSGIPGPWGLTLAGGGPVRGEGGPRDDKVPAWLSNGEFVVNARSTSKHRALLDAINADSTGRLARYASGGPVGKADFAAARFMARSGPIAPRSGPGTLIVEVKGARGNREIEEMVDRGVRSGIGRYDYVKRNGGSAMDDKQYSSLKSGVR